jgi:hypothetical protein
MKTRGRQLTLVTQPTLATLVTQPTLATLVTQPTPATLVTQPTPAPISKDKKSRHNRTERDRIRRLNDAYDSLRCAMGNEKGSKVRVIEQAAKKLTAFCQAVDSGNTEELQILRASCKATDIATADDVLPATSGIFDDLLDTCDARPQHTHRAR